MYGFIHCCLSDLVTKLYGKEVWTNVIERAGVNLSGGEYLLHGVYSDSETFKLIESLLQITGLHKDQILQSFGEHFLQYCIQSGYNGILKVMGRTLNEFLCNLDALHDHLSNTYPGMNAPSFRTSNRLDGGFDLHYYSNRDGLEYIVIGIVKTIAKEYLHTEIDISIEKMKSKTHDHVVFCIKQRKIKSRRLSMTLLQQQYQPQITSLSEKHKINPAPRRNRVIERNFMNTCSFIRLFPYHVIFDRNLKMKQCGLSLMKYFSTLGLNSSELSFYDIFRFLRPRMDVSFDTFLTHINTVFVVSLRILNDNTLLGKKHSPDSTSLFTKREKDIRSTEIISKNYAELKLKGQMIYLVNKDWLLFLCSPRVKNLDELENHNLYLSDIPLHCATRQIIMETHSTQYDRELIKSVETSTNNLRMFNSKLKERRDSTDYLLFELLPRSVVSLLKAGHNVPTESHELVSVIFSDLVGFTALSSNENVTAMDIIKLLNQIYTVYDAICVVLEVFKVETIGDGYMGVTGIPQYCADHTERICNMACQMISDIQEIKSPVKSHPIEVRIGIHAGPVIAGVVGQKMPKYCVFGKTVTVANTMESTSQPGRINISEDAKRHLIQENWSFQKNNTATVDPPSYFVSSKLKEEGSELQDKVIKTCKGFVKLLKVESPRLRKKGLDSD